MKKLFLLSLVFIVTTLTALASSVAFADFQDAQMTDETMGVREPGKNPPGTIDPVCHKLKSLNSGLYNPALKSISNLAEGQSSSSSTKSAE